MAKQKRSRQTWWPLDVLALMMIGLLFLVHRLAPSPGWRAFLEVGVVVVGYGLIALWLETHPNISLPRPPVEEDSLVVQWPELEMSASLSDPVRRQVYIGSDLAIIEDEPEDLTGNLGSNGHHRLARTPPSLPEETAE
ncbi:MAG: hypothetical protein AB1801_03605 [Chloroflexota bacterium]